VINAYKSLNAQTLRQIWGPETIKSAELEQKLPLLIALTLNRRDQVLRAAQKIKAG
jgi:hypothetical protein